MYCSCFFSSDFASCSALKTFGGHVSFYVLRELGAVHKALFFTRPYTVDLLVSRSTVFICVGMYLYWLGSLYECQNNSDQPDLQQMVSVYNFGF